MSSEKYYCAAITCPGFSYKASDHAHPCPPGEDRESLKEAFRALHAENIKLQGDLGACRRGLECADERYSTLVKDVGSLHIHGMEYAVVPQEQWDALLAEREELAELREQTDCAEMIADQYRSENTMLLKENASFLGVAPERLKTMRKALDFVRLYARTRSEAFAANRLWPDAKVILEELKELPVRLTAAEASKLAVDQLEKAAGVQQSVPEHIVKEVEDRLKRVTPQEWVDAGVLSKKSTSIVEQRMGTDGVSAWEAMMQEGLYLGMGAFESLLYVQAFRRLYPRDTLQDTKRRFLRGFGGRVNPAQLSKALEIVFYIEKGTG